jgi:hypothetical protein
MPFEAHEHGWNADEQAQGAGGLDRYEGERSAADRQTRREAWSDPLDKQKRSAGDGQTRTAG